MVSAFVALLREFSPRKLNILAPLVCPGLTILARLYRQTSELPNQMLRGRHGLVIAKLLASNR